MKYECIADHRDVLPVAMMCRLLEIKPSGFYAWLRRSPSKRSQDDQRYPPPELNCIVISSPTDGVYRVRVEMYFDGEDRLHWWVTFSVPNPFAPFLASNSRIYYPIELGRYVE